MKEIQIYEVSLTDNLFIVTDQNRDARYYDKKTLTVEADNDYVVLKENGTVILRELPTSFVVPKESSTVDLVEILQGYLDNLLPEIGSIANPYAVQLGDSMSVDSFGRLRTSEPANRWSCTNKQ